MNIKNRKIMAKNFENIMKLAEYGADRHTERRNIIFRIFIAYMTFLIVASGLILRHQKDELVESLWFILPATVFLVVVFIIYWLWLRIFYIASDYDVRRRDFYLKKAEIICYYFSKNLETKEYSHCKEIPINLGSDKSYLISEKDLFEKKAPDIQPKTDPNICWKDPPAPIVRKNLHFWFHFCAPLGLTILIVAILIF